MIRSSRSCSRSGSNRASGGREPGDVGLRSRTAKRAATPPRNPLRYSAFAQCVRLGGRRNALGATRNALGAARNAPGATRNVLGATRNARGAARDALGAARNSLGAARNALRDGPILLDACRNDLAARPVGPTAVRTIGDSRMRARLPQEKRFRSICGRGSFIRLEGERASGSSHRGHRGKSSEVIEMLNVVFRRSPDRGSHPAIPVQCDLFAFGFALGFALCASLARRPAEQPHPQFFWDIDITSFPASLAFAS